VARESRRSARQPRPIPCALIRAASTSNGDAGDTAVQKCALANRSLTLQRLRWTGFAVLAAGGNISCEAAAGRRHEPDQPPPTYFCYGVMSACAAAGSG
jgi:hypothetical protein